jgi:predicted Zn-dependent protease
MGMGTVSDVLTLTSAAITNGYQRFLEDQADRYGVALMAERGYNPLQSIQVWINMTRNFGDAPSDFFWSSHSSHTERISYLLLAVRDNYPDRSSEDFERMELGAERYLGATEELRSDPRLAKLRKRMEAYRKKYDEEEGPLKF